MLIILDQYMQIYVKAAFADFMRNINDIFITLLIINLSSLGLAGFVTFKVQIFQFTEKSFEKIKTV